MSMEYIIIYELIAVLLIVVLIGAVIWRDKSSEISDLKELNQSLMDQIEDMQRVLARQSKEKQAISSDYQDVEEAIHEQLDTAVGDSDANWQEMEKLVQGQKQIVDNLGSQLLSEEPDLSVMKKELGELQKQLEKSERKIRVQKKELSTSKNNIKTLKDKMRNLSQKVLSMGGLELSERRLRKDKERLRSRVDELKTKYQDQRLISKNLEQELKTSFRASEVQGMKDQLKQLEASLSRTEAEKAFIEQHFMELSEQGDPEKLQEELGRAKREIQLLEQTVLEMDSSESKNSDS